MVRQVEERTGGANRFLEQDSATSQLHAEASRYMPGGTSRLHYYFRPYPIYIRSGTGCRLTDVEGVERIDFLNCMTALIHGHANPAVNAAIVEQLQRGTAFSEPAELEVALAKLLCERVKSIEQIRFSNSGTEAVMMAIKLARAFTGKSRIAKFEGHYHGYYDYVQVSYGSSPEEWGPDDAPASVPSSGGLSATVPGEVVVMPFNDEAAVERILAREGSSIAAIILDPLSQRSGCPRPVPGFLTFLQEIARQHGILTIYDEVISFRIAYDGAQGRYQGAPDLTTLGKVIGGGLPVGAVGGRADVMVLLDPSRGAPTVVSGGTFSGNPLTVAAGLAAMQQLTPEAYDRLNARGDDLRTRANAVFQAAGEKGQLTGDGSLFRIMLTDEPIVDYRSSVRRAAPADRMARLHRALLNEGIIVGNNGLGALSTVMGQAEVDAFVDALSRAIERIQSL